MRRPWQTVERVETAEGALELRQRGEVFLITVAGRVLMNSWANTSEKVLAESACRSLRNPKDPRVLVAGLGMGFTLRAALDPLPVQAVVVVAELNPVVVAWCRGPIAHLTDRAVDDPRVTVVVGDVAAVIRQAAAAGDGERFDAIVLDLYEGPYEGNEGPLFGARALQRCRAALRDGGVLAVWSEESDRAFEQRLAAAGFTVSQQRPGQGGRRHVVYLGVKRGR